MTKVEYGKCEKLMFDAIQKAKQADEEYKAYNQLIKNDKIRAEIEQRKADQHIGYAEGINVLAVIGFKHDRMKEFSELL
ncbi:MAG: hypothetical protein K2N51_09670 [Lachnospiraceae bacterium]|nr:hypothetical protein [Lachnospiraceae bacterium]